MGRGGGRKCVNRIILGHAARWHRPHSIEWRRQSTAEKQSFAAEYAKCSARNNILAGITHTAKTDTASMANTEIGSRMAKSNAPRSPSCFKVAIEHATALVFDKPV
jgi:hypothetical protein